MGQRGGLERALWVKCFQLCRLKLSAPSSSGVVEGSIWGGLERALWVKAITKERLRWGEAAGDEGLYQIKKDNINYSCNSTQDLIFSYVLHQFNHTYCLEKGISWTSSLQVPSRVEICLKMEREQKRADETCFARASSTLWNFS